MSNEILKDTLRGTIGIWLIFPLTGWPLLLLPFMKLFFLILGMPTGRTLLEALEHYYISDTVVEGGNPVWILHLAFILGLLMFNLVKACNDHDYVTRI